MKEMIYKSNFTMIIVKKTFLVFMNQCIQYVVVTLIIHHVMYVLY